MQPIIEDEVIRGIGKLFEGEKIVGEVRYQLRINKRLPNLLVKSNLT